MANATLEKVYDELKSLKKDVRFIKQHMVDVDTMLTPEEEERFEEGMKEYKEGKAVSLEDFEKEMERNA
jgi:hypothetical protein